MGQRSNTETIVAILKAFLDHRTWKQADLARHVGVQPATIHKRLEELRANGVPLDSEKDHPHVYWSVPKSWYPGGVLFTGEQVTQMFRQLSRLPKSKARNQLIETILKYLPSRETAVAVVPAETTPREEQYLPTIEDSGTERVALKFRYFTAHRGSEGTRHASVHRVLLGPPARFVATCHRSGELKWFRVENVSDARLDKAEAFRDCDAKKVDAYLRASLDGWDDLIAHLEGADVTRFLRHYLLIRHARVQKDRVFELFKDDVQTRGAQGLLDELLTMARWYGQFVKPQKAEHARTRQVLADLETLRAVMCYTLLLAARRFSMASALLYGDQSCEGLS